MARLVPAGVTLRAQVNERWPDRDKGADGWIGDADHQARASDHNPDADGWVHAIDIDKDGIDADALADQLVAYCRARKPGSERIKNIVWKDRVASGTYASKFWVWRYDDSLGHFDHIHVSFTDAAERDGSPFPLAILEDDVALTPDDIEKIAHAVWNKTYGDPIDGGKLASTASLVLRARIDANKAATQPVAEAVPVNLDALAAKVADLLAARLAQ